MGDIFDEGRSSVILAETEERCLVGEGVPVTAAEPHVIGSVTWDVVLTSEKAME